MRRKVEDIAIRSIVSSCLNIFLHLHHLFESTSASYALHHLFVASYVCICIASSKLHHLFSSSTPSTLHQMLVASYASVCYIIWICLLHHLQNSHIYIFFVAYKSKILLLHNTNIYWRCKHEKGKLNCVWLNW